jgi:hypothetical protein
MSDFSERLAIPSLFDSSVLAAFLDQLRLQRHRKIHTKQGDGTCMPS